jgi:thioesterase domain-containing protein/acyl carrier protein
MTITDQILDIIADETGVERNELDDDCEFAELGIDDLLAKCIITRVHEELDLSLSPTFFLTTACVAALKSELAVVSAEPTQHIVNPAPSSGRIDSLSFVLQGNTSTCRKIIFLLPDGSGAAMAYARLPRIDIDVCLVALNSPYLRAGPSASFTVDGIAKVWANEIQSRQAHGPYILGGWSAGGYYTFEVAKYLIRTGEHVESLVLIDSPCRLVYEALPISVVEYLSRNDLMGNWGDKAPPSWMINHFELSIRAIERYTPTKMHASRMPDVFLLWAEEGMLNGSGPRTGALDMSAKVTRMLIERPESSGALGWDTLFPQAKILYAKVPGNHFTIVYPPYVSWNVQEGRNDSTLTPAVQHAITTTWRRRSRACDDSFG